MNAPSAAVIEEFAREFAQKGKGRGLTRNEILAFFRRYSNNVIDPDLSLTKQSVFHHCLERLHVEDQYRALIDLGTIPLESENPLPDETTRARLLEMLHDHSYPTGVSRRTVALDSWPIKREWLKAASRVEKNPAAAITSARTTLERTCREVLEAAGEDSRSADLGKLVKGARKALNLSGATGRAAQGVATIVQSIAEAANAAGDRHASRDNTGATLAEARLMCDMSMALCLFLVDEWKLQAVSERGSLSASGPTSRAAGPDR